MTPAWGRCLNCCCRTHGPGWPRFLTLKGSAQIAHTKFQRQPSAQGMLAVLKDYMSQAVPLSRGLAPPGAFFFFKLLLPLF